MKIKVCTLFSGYDSQCMALDRLRKKYPQFDYELVAWAEIDKYAIAAHNAVYPQYAGRNAGDVRQINWDAMPDFDLLTYSAPCQDYSMIGTQKGGELGSGTRSSLLWEVERAISIKKPKWCIMENVAQMASDRFINQLNQWQSCLQSHGYTNFAKRINAANYVPQNRERLYMVSIHDCKNAYYFPSPSAPVAPVKSIFEKNVPSHYYVHDTSNWDCNEIEPILLGWTRSTTGNHVSRHAVEIANCVTANKHLNTQNYVCEIASYRVRKLTEKECFRLMGVSDADSDKIMHAVSRTHCSRLAGNAIVVDVLAAILESLLFNQSNQYQQLELF